MSSLLFNSRCLSPGTGEVGSGIEDEGLETGGVYLGTDTLGVKSGLCN